MHLLVFRWYDMSPYESEVEKEQDTFTNIKYYYSHVANGVRHLHKHYFTNIKYYYSHVVKVVRLPHKD